MKHFLAVVVVLALVCALCIGCTPEEKNGETSEVNLPTLTEPGKKDTDPESETGKSDQGPETEPGTSTDALETPEDLETIESGERDEVGSTENPVDGSVTDPHIETSEGNQPTVTEPGQMDPGKETEPGNSSDVPESWEDLEPIGSEEGNVVGSTEEPVVVSEPDPEEETIPDYTVDGGAGFGFGGN